jgi:hypothetical protein
MTEHILESAIPALEGGAVAFTVTTLAPSRSIQVPFFLLTWWINVVNPIVSAHSAWKLAFETIELHHGEQLYDSVCESLQYLEWDAILPVGMGGGSAQSLSAYFMKDWLRDTHLYQMQYILELHLERHQVNCQLLSPDFFQWLLCVYRNKTRTNTYKDAVKNQQSFKKAGNKFVKESTKLAFVININVSSGAAVLPFYEKTGNHWVVVVLEFASEKIWYYDSLQYE